LRKLVGKLVNLIAPQEDGPNSLPSLELAAASVLWLHLFLLIASLVIGRSVGSALFLNQFDVRGLAVVYVLVGCVVAGLITVLEWRSRDASTIRVAFVTLLLSYMVTIVAGLVIPWLGAAEVPIAFGLLYVFIECFALVTTIQFWAMANSALLPGQAQRLYVLITTGGIAGSIVGGAVTVCWIHGIPARALLCLVGLIPCQLATLVAFRLLAQRLRKWTPKNVHRWNLDGAGGKLGLQQLGRDSAELPHPSVPVATESMPRVLALRFGLVSLLMVFTTTLVDFYYKVTADATFAGDVGRLGSFFGGFYLAVGLVTLLTQLVATPVVLRNGTAFAGLWLSPAGLALLVVINWLGPGLWPATVFKVGESAVTHSVYRSCQEMLYTPLPTGWVRRLKSFSDGVLGRYGLLLAGCFLFGLSRSVERHGPIWVLPWIAASLAAWAIAIYQLKREYRAQSSKDGYVRRNVEPLASAVPADTRKSGKPRPLREAG
jgi:ATP/ADP translocase